MWYVPICWVSPSLDLHKQLNEQLMDIMHNPCQLFNEIFI
ncbi:hypothetical protein HMPREF1568_0049 [Providencia alcalifaciens PAL-3]|nr:hypothetical protein HMPREF1568_0049 [Providencia alcalifaciens PAL-3]EUD00757.1 hypothetical protein HMPREF1566_2639 [Providencia alcalifaciens PAL-1]